MCAKLIFQPRAVVERVIQAIQVRSARFGLGGIKRNAQLHVNALEQRFCQLVDARAPGWH